MCAAAPVFANDQQVPSLLLSFPDCMLKLAIVYGRVPQLPLLSLQQLNPYHGSNGVVLFLEDGSISEQSFPPYKVTLRSAKCPGLKSLLAGLATC
jgi:hypothetical protein